jgi:hypothetical protein
VTCIELNGVEHTNSGYGGKSLEAVALGLAAYGRNVYWRGEIAHGQTTITVVLKQTEVEHKVGMSDFEACLESNGRSPQGWRRSRDYVNF